VAHIKKTQKHRKLSRIIDQIPNRLNKNNIEKAIVDYQDLLRNIPLEIQAKNVLRFLTDLKRKKLNSGPYPNVTLFESANRIMSDLTILYGIKELLNGAINGINYDEYVVEFGHDNYNENDVYASDGITKLIGEGFNVSKTFFQTKKAKSLRKMRAQKSENDKLILIYNADAVSENYNPIKKPNEYHLKINLDILMQ